MYLKDLLIIEMTIGRKSVSITKDWNTPIEYINKIKKFFGQICLDPCSNEFSIVNAKTEYRLPNHNGLEESWNYETIYCNPPYGRNGKTSIKNWLEKCSDSYSKYNNQIIALIPVATNTKHWQQNIFKNANSICFLKVPRLKFYLNGKENKKGSPMACCLVYWGDQKEKFEAEFSDLGKVVQV